MYFARIDLKNRTLTFRDWFWTRSVEFSELKKLTIARGEVSLLDEVGFLFLDSKGKEYWILRNQSDIVAMGELLRLNELLGADWYRRAEAGEVLTTDVAFSS